jgi:hypothetical protein
MEIYQIIVVWLLLMIVITLPLVNSKCTNVKITKQPSKCSVSSCSGIDPVSDPRYNMQQIVKQSILLEEHLANKNKRCRDCITKHFLHIIGLAEEAQMLATNKIDKYPLINECVELYNTLFKKWITSYELDHTNNDNFCYCGDELRNMRKKLIAVYFFNDDTFLNH